MPHIRQLTCFVIFGIFASFTQAADTPMAAIASNMSYVMSDIATAFQKETDTKVRLTFGSSGNFARQIVQGAPFKLFLSADKKYVDFLRNKGMNLIADVNYARGRIGLYIPKNSNLYKNTDLESAIKMIIHGNYSRLAIANPEHAPYGLAAQQALQSAGLWVTATKRLLLAENAAQTMQVALSGNVDVAVISASFMHLTDVKSKGKFFLIPESWHKPLLQHLVLLEGASVSERELFEYMQNKESQLVVQKYGYDIK
jgi:molybdate transport system substrate-binding protein